MQFFTKAASRRVLLNFETPNWYAEAGQTEIDESKWRGWELTSRCCEGVVSSLELSSSYAKKYYTAVAPGTQFLSLPPAINSIAADLAAKTPRVPRRIFLATRLNKGSSAHKGGQYIRAFLDESFRGYELIILIGGGKRDPQQMAEVQNLAGQHGVKVQFLRAVTDLEKYRWMSSCSVSAFLTSFEGYGYPPIESLYCGTPCIAFDLPNYNETCGVGLTRVAQGDINGVKAMILEGNYVTDPAQFAQARTIGGFTDFSQRALRVLQAVSQTTVDSSTWPSALAELGTYQPPRGLKHLAKRLIKSWTPTQAVKVKRILDQLR